MTTHPTRRGAQSRKPATCKREGCSSRRTNNGYCTVLCKTIDSELDQIRRLRDALGPLPVLSQWWAETVTVGDSWSRRLELVRELGEAANEVGITREQLREIRFGPGEVSVYR